MFAPCRLDMEVLSPNLNDKEVSQMTSYEILDLVISIIGLVLSAVIIGITIEKKNTRH